MVGKRVGFTGTRDGMTVPQHEQFARWVREHVPSQFHHGECRGADEQAVWEVTRHSAVVVVAHPCTLRGERAKTAVGLSAFTHPVKAPLVRNRDIVNACDVLLACPKGPEELRSGTWMTVRYARKAGKPVVIFWPDGRVEERHDLPRADERVGEEPGQ